MRFLVFFIIANRFPYHRTVWTPRLEYSLNDTQQKIIKLISEDHQLSAVKLAEKIGVASRNIENNIKKLKEYGILIRHGSPKNGYWEIVDKDLQE